MMTRKEIHDLYRLSPQLLRLYEIKHGDPPGKQRIGGDGKKPALLTYDEKQFHQWYVKYVRPNDVELDVSQSPISGYEN